MAKWKITDMNIVSDEGRDLVDFVHTIKFSCTEVVNGNLGLVESSVVLPMADNSNFTPIRDVTENQAMAWLFDALGTENKQYIEEEVLSKAMPKMENETPQWLNKENN